MLLREVLSDTPQRLSVELADQEEYCSLSLKVACQRSVAASILNREWVIRWNKFREIFISYHGATGECPFNLC